MPDHVPKIRPKVLVVRLSSLGDVILATAALAVPRLRDVEVHWLVSQELAPLLKQDARIHRVWEFDRGSGLGGWLRIGAKLSAESFDEVLDLHRSLRSRVLRLCMRGSWRTLKKHRMRLFGTYVFKAAWPKSWGVRPFVERYARTAGGTGTERPDLAHLLHGPPLEGLPGAYFCVMPGTRWPGKRWPPEKYAQAIAASPAARKLDAVILGASGEPGAKELAYALEARGIRALDGTGRWSLPEIARVLSGAKAYFGNDTGFAHLAEAVGTPAVVVFGPTDPLMGFGPWRDSSQAVHADLWCRPCGKDGRACFRVTRRHLCLSACDPDVAARALDQVLSR
jgi:ADP-heptose:LPS heptosyltransferase